MKKLIGITILITLVFCLFANERPKIGLVLSGGGAKGIAHVGVLKVLEEHGIRPDYITGTSMGAIIGALYSIGYTAQELEEIVFSQDWQSLMTDKRDRQNQSFMELENGDKYQLSFPFKDGKIILPTGFINGQNIITLLSSLTIPVHNITDFSELPIPFACIGTDIETGEPIVMDHGVLSEAIRSSMSIPSVFSPSEWENYRLLDGGLVNNFPVNQVRQMGAEIIIGVDISSSIATRDQLNNMVSVINQAISYRGYASTEEQRKSCDILITPSLTDYTIMSFDKLRDIYNIGEYATRQHSDELTALSCIMHDYNREDVVFPPRGKKEFLIKRIRVVGLENIPSYAVRGWMNIRIPSVVQIQKIEDSIQRLVSTKSFEQIHYRLLSREEGDGYELEIRLKEKESNYVSLGGNFNSEDYASVLLQININNLLKRGSSLNLSARLNPKAEIDVNHMFLSGWNSGVGIVAGVSLNVSEIYSYNDYKRVGDSNYLSKLYLYCGPTLLLSNVFSAFLTYSHEINFLESNRSLKKFDYQKETDKISLILHRDFLDDVYFPRKGGWTYTRLENCFIEGMTSSFENQVQRLIVNNRSAVPINRNISLHLGLNLGLSTENNKLNNNSFFLGGNRLIDYTTFPFPAMSIRKKRGNNVYVGKFGIQYGFNSFLYLSANSYYAEVKDDVDDLLRGKDGLLGGSLDLGVRTILGAINLSLQKNDIYTDYSGFINIGYNY